VSPDSNHVRRWHLLPVAAQNAGNGYLGADHFFGDFLIFAGDAAHVVLVSFTSSQKSTGRQSAGPAGYSSAYLPRRHDLRLRCPARGTCHYPKPHVTVRSISPSAGGYRAAAGNRPCRLVPGGEQARRVTRQELTDISRLYALDPLRAKDSPQMRGVSQPRGRRRFGIRPLTLHNRRPRFLVFAQLNQMHAKQVAKPLDQA
jgi:hypothetical protein